MRESFDAVFFTANRERLQGLFTGTAPIVLTANGLLQRNSDVTYPFRQDSSFWYFTGITDPDVTLVMDKGKEYLIVPDRDDNRTAFDGAIDVSALTKISGVKAAFGEAEGWKQLGARLKKVKHVATLAAAPAYVEHHGIYTNPARARLIERLTENNPEIDLLDLRPHITRLRMQKQSVEIAAIQEAIDLTASVLKKLRKSGFAKFEYEYEVEAAILQQFRSQGAGHAYSPIVAAGKNACTLHYIENSDKIAQDSLILLDIGAEISHYAADITRTYAVTEPNKRQRQVYEAVLAVQNYAIAALKPGATLKAFEELVFQFMGEKLRELALIKNIDRESVRKYYPHATSHFLGLDVHDVGEYDKPLEVGAVLTVEPGIYIPEEGIGIRIEDNILVSENGPEILSAKLPRVLE